MGHLSENGWPFTCQNFLSVCESVNANDRQINAIEPVGKLLANYKTGRTVATRTIN